MESIKSVNNLSDDELIELARQAKAVPVPIDGKNYVSSTDLYTPIYEFFKATGLAPGRNKVYSKAIYDAFCAFTNISVSYRKFSIECTKVLPKSSKRYYKTNMTGITLYNRVKELRNEEIKEK